MRIAAMSGELERAEERGYKKGYGEGRDKSEKTFIPKLLKKTLLKKYQKNTAYHSNAF